MFMFQYFVSDLPIFCLNVLQIDPTTNEIISAFKCDGSIQFFIIRNVSEPLILRPA